MRLANGMVIVTAMAMVSALSGCATPTKPPRGIKHVHRTTKPVLIGAVGSRELIGRVDEVDRAARTTGPRVAPAAVAESGDGAVPLTPNSGAGPDLTASGSSAADGGQDVPVGAGNGSVNPNPANMASGDPSLMQGVSMDDGLGLDQPPAPPTRKVRFGRLILAEENPSQPVVDGIGTDQPVAVSGQP